MRPVERGRDAHDLDLAIELRLRPDRDFEVWAKESMAIAAFRAYRSGDVKGSTDKAEAPVLPDGYAAEAKAIAERRIVLTGYRVAGVLRDLQR